MPFLFNREYTKAELRQYISDPSQIAGIRLVEYDEGKARGLRVAQFYTGSGFDFQILLDRAMDIGTADHNGRAIGWTYPTLATPPYYSPRAYDWIRTWGGGLMTTCGLTFFGQPENDNGEELGLHGPFSHIPAQNIGVTTEWRGEDYVLELTGQVRQTYLRGENLLLTRRISTKLGADSFTITDTLVNDGFEPAPHMILYHCNFGFPVVSPDSELFIDEESVRPRDEIAAKGMGQQNYFQNPASDYPEQVFFHSPCPDPEGFARACIVNHALNFGAYVKWRMKELPYMGQWKLLLPGRYVCALEPANYFETPRRKLREEGRLRMLEPGETVEYVLELGAIPNPPK